MYSLWVSPIICTIISTFDHKHSWELMLLSHAVGGYEEGSESSVFSQSCCSWVCFLLLQWSQWVTIIWLLVIWYCSLPLNGALLVGKGVVWLWILLILDQCLCSHSVWIRQYKQVYPWESEGILLPIVFTAKWHWNVLPYCHSATEHKVIVVIYSRSVLINNSIPVLRTSPLIDQRVY